MRACLSEWRDALLAVLLAVPCISACTDHSSEQDRLELSSGRIAGTVRISGSTTMAPMITALSHEFEKQNPEVNFQMQLGGSGQGLKDVQQGRSDIGMVSRVLTAEERDWLPFVIARDGIAISVHSDNKVGTLSNEQVAGIYTKKILNWREVGGNDAPIFAIGSTPAAGSTDLFLHQFAIEQSRFKPDLLADANADRFSALANNPSAILYSSLGESERRGAAGDKVRALPNAGVAATSENLAAGRYAIARPLALVTKGLPSGASKGFIDYVRSPDAVPTIRRFDFVPYRD